MSWIAPRTWLVGEVLPAALLNAQIRDNLLYLKGVADDAVLLSAANVLAGASNEFQGDVKFDEHVYFDAEVDNGNSGASKMIDWTAGNNQKIVMTGNCTFTFTAPSGTGKHTLKCIGDGTARTPVWPSTAPGKVYWGTAGAPVLTGTSGRWDILIFHYDGTNYSGGIGGQAYGE